jgi:PEGA domain-containing protein
MNRTRLVPAIAGFLLCSLPLAAAGQARSRGTAVAQGQAVPRSGAVSRQAQPPASPAPPPVAAPGAPIAAPPQASSGPQMPPSRRVDFPMGVAVPRAIPRNVPPTAPRVAVPQAVVPQVVQPRIDVIRPGDFAYRSDYRPNYRPNYRPDYRPDYRPNYGPAYRGDYRTRYPYYTFRPRIRIGFALWVGHPVRYPYVIPPVAYSYPYYPQYPFGTPAYPYPYPSTVYQTTRPIPVPAAAPGGLSFDITPPDAEVFIDGQYVGVVSQFSPTQPPLWLAPGRHRVEIRMPGYDPVVFDVDIISGEVIPYQGDMRRF